MTPEDLVEIELIKRLKHRYLRCLDQKLWDGVESCFLPDSSASYGGGAHEFDDRQQIMEFLRSAMGATTMLSSHRATQPEIDLTGDGSATGIWALSDVIILTDLEITVQGASFYDDTYTKVDGTWFIARTTYKRTYEEMWPRSSTQGLQITADWWATDGRSSLG